MKSKETKIMGGDLSFIGGFMIGIEFVDDEDFNYFFMDLGIIRLAFFKEKK